MKSLLSRRDFLVKSSILASSPLISPLMINELPVPEKADSQMNSKCRMKVGSDTDKLPGEVKKAGAFAVLDYLKERGFDGAFFRLMLDLSPTLDPGELKEVKAHADSLGLFQELAG